MAPEVLHGTPYDHTVDYWSLGCMLFETLVGYPPFAGQTPDDTWCNLKHWKKVLVRPVFEKGSGDEEFNLQDPAWEFITRCISERRDRLQSIDEVKGERYFTMSLRSAGKLDWDGIRKTTVRRLYPFLPPHFHPFSRLSLFVGLWWLLTLAAVRTGPRIRRRRGLL